MHFNCLDLSKTLNKYNCAVCAAVGIKYRASPASEISLELHLENPNLINNNKEEK